MISCRFHKYLGLNLQHLPFGLFFQHALGRLRCNLDRIGPPCWNLAKTSTWTASFPFAREKNRMNWCLKFGKLNSNIVGHRTCKLWGTFLVADVFWMATAAIFAVQSSDPIKSCMVVLSFNGIWNHNKGTTGKTFYCLGCLLLLLRLCMLCSVSTSLCPCGNVWQLFKVFPAGTMTPTQRLFKIPLRRTKQQNRKHVFTS